MNNVFKKMLVTLLCMFMLVSIGSYGFAKEVEFTTNKPIANMEVKEINKIYDADGDKLVESLEEKMKETKSDEKLSVTVVFKEKFDGVKDQVKKVLGDYNTKYEYKNIPAATMKLNKNQINKLSKLDIVQQIEYDEEVKAFMNTARYWYGTEKACNDFGVDGNRDGNINSYSANDVVIAVIDTGIDEGHVDLDNGKVIGWKDYVNNQNSPYDDNGHGTHVSGIIAGEGDGNAIYQGVAKGAALVGLKVLDSNGSGSMSDVTAAIDWCVTNKNTYGIDVINLSLGTSGSSDGTDAASLAVNNAYANGIVVAVAAGNSGSAKYTIGSPGAAADALTVGSMVDVGEGGFQLAYYSSRGYTADDRIKPDICSPGTNITAPQANTTSSYVSKSGTSMATPFTAGVIALMLDANSNLTPSQIRNILTTTAQDWGPNGQDIDYGYGKIDGYNAVKQAGNYSGSNLTLPNHIYASETLANTGSADMWEFNVNDTSYPISVTFIMPDWNSNTDFDIYLYDSNGNQLKRSIGTSRQEQLSFTPTSTGIYKLKAYSYRGSGNYFFDLSVGGTNLTLTQDQ